MSNLDSLVFNFQQFIQLETVKQNYPFYTGIFSQLVDEDFYLEQYPDVADALINNLISSAEEHFRTSGANERRVPHAFYDEDLYLLANPDVKAVVESGAIASGIQHYLSFGFSEGRDSFAMNVEIGGLQISKLFDETFYLNQLPDIATVVSQGSFANGYEHFLRFGIAEGRSPSLYYDETLYLSLNPDVQNAVNNGSFQSGLEHYLLTGHIENRAASLLFTVQQYLAQNEDVAQAIDQGTISSAFEHYLDFGIAEGRQPSTLFFEETYYLAQNSGVASAIAAGTFQSGYEHFLRFGMQEGRKPNANYSEADYLNTNPTVKSAVEAGTFRSGLEHYILFGRQEGRLLVPEVLEPLDYSTSDKAVLVNLADDNTLFLNTDLDPRIMPVGDSITEGTEASNLVQADPSIIETHEGYRLNLWQKFQDLGLPVDFVGSLSSGTDNLGDKDHEGHRGRSFSFFNQSNRIDTFINDASPDIMLLMLGTNESTDGESIANELSGLLDNILDNPSFTGQILVGTIAPVHPDGNFTQRAGNFADYNSRIPGVLDSKNSDRLTFVEVGSLLDARQDMTDPTLDNGVHPNESGYAKMADAWYDAILDLVVANQQSVNSNDVTGSNFDDVLIGNSQTNLLEGGTGSDLLTGNGGSDTFLYNSINDGIDTITDFSADDFIGIVSSGFAGNLSAGFDFFSGNNPTASSRAAFLYNTTTGALSYDQDGSGGQSATQFIQFEAAPSLVTSQIVIV